MCRRLYGKDSLVDAILEGFVDYRILAECKDIYEDKLTKTYVEACLLATEDFSDIAETLQLDKFTLMMYHDIYYNVHDLSLIHKTQHLSNIDDQSERNLKQWSMTSGMDFVKWRLGLTTKQSMVDSIKHLHSDAFFRSKEAFFNSNTTGASAEGLKWSRQVIGLTRLLMDMESGNSENAEDDLMLELDRIDENNNDIPGIEDLQ